MLAKSFGVSKTPLLLSRAKHSTFFTAAYPPSPAPPVRRSHAWRARVPRISEGWSVTLVDHKLLPAPELLFHPRSPWQKGSDSQNIVPINLPFRKLPPDVVGPVRLDVPAHGIEERGRGPGSRLTGSMDRTRMAMRVNCSSPILARFARNS